MTLPHFAAAGLRLDPVMPEDVPVLLTMLGELAEFLKVPQNFVNTQESLTDALFSAPPAVEAVIARHEGKPAGFASWLETYRVFSGKRSMWLDYIYVRPDFRSKPLALAMLAYALGIARERDYLAIQGTILDWNETARTLYSTIGVEELASRTFDLKLSKVNWALLGYDKASTATVDRPSVERSSGAAT